MTHRTITYLFDRATLDRLYETLGEAGVDPAAARVEIDGALAYLTTWALDAYPRLSLNLQVDPLFGIEFIAVYAKDGAPDYVIGGVWDASAKRFGFHS